MSTIASSAAPWPPQLVEHLARNLQDWRVQQERDVPWEALSEASRRTLCARATNLLDAVVAAGFTVVPATAEDRTSDTPTTAADSSVQEQVERWRDEAEQQLRVGEPLLAYNAVKQGLEACPQDLRLRQLEGLALARSGAVERANKVLQQLRDEGHDDGETLGLLARTHKDLGLAAPDTSSGGAHLGAAFTIYENAYLQAVRRGAVADAYYTGINAATLAVLRGHELRAREIAEVVRRLCQQELEESNVGGGEYWVRATLGEASLILGDLNDARHEYSLAGKLAATRFADLASTRRQARLLLRSLELPAAWLDEILRVPPVVVYTGHMVDRPGRGTPRFPAAIEERVRVQLRQRLEAISPVAAYGSAACGTDILVLETMLELGGEIHIVLPFSPEEFRRVSVDLDPDGDWGERFDRVMAGAASVIVASDDYAQDSTASFEYANLILTGMAQLRARVLETPLIGVAVWDGAAGDGPGGTGSVVTHWRDQGIKTQLVDLARLLEEEGIEPGEKVSEQRNQPPQRTGAQRRFRHEIKAMLFADAVGYSKLKENQIPLFIDKFLGAVAELNRRTQYGPIHMETAGDGLYFVFDSARDAGHYAMQLNRLVRETEWQPLGFPASFDLRVGLHCGPVYCCEDPITGLPLYTGPHTSRTARIEPITPPGQVYGSSAFAAIAATTGVDDLQFSYIGRTNLAKKYGALALYHITPNQTSS